MIDGGESRGLAQTNRPQRAGGEEIADLLSEIGRTFKRRLRGLPGSPAAALSAPQRDVLVRIGRRPGTTPAGICERTGRDRGQVTRLVAELEALGLVERARSAQDRRSIVLVLSAAGADLFGRMLERRAGLADRMLADLDAGETQRLRSMLQTVRNALRDWPDGSPVLDGTDADAPVGGEDR